MNEDISPLTPVLCPHCGSDVPPGEFCGACGSHLVTGSPGASHRSHAFTANPHEHVLQGAIISTLFPHLPHRRSTPFRLTLALVTLALFLLGYLRLTGPSIAVAAFAVPLLYLLYLYEVEIYEDEPAYVLAVTVVLGGILGAFWAHATGPLVTRTLLLNLSPSGAPISRVLLVAVLFPLVAQLLMLAGALIMYLTRQYDEALDGFAFGTSGAMGFVLASTLVNLFPEIQGGLISAAPAIDNTLTIVQRGLLIPFIDAGTTGLIGGALWLRRGRSRPLGARGWTTSLWVALLAAGVTQVLLALVSVEVVTPAVATGIYGLVAFLLLFAVRIALHHLLLAEAVETPVGPSGPCSHCYRIVPRMAFCPHCGVATRAAPKVGAGRLGRSVR